jgi:hypothetical protein
MDLVVVAVVVTVDFYIPLVLFKNYKKQIIYT